MSIRLDMSQCHQTHRRIHPARIRQCTGLGNRIAPPLIRCPYPERSPTKPIAGALKAIILLHASTIWLAVLNLPGVLTSAIVHDRPFVACFVYQSSEGVAKASHLHGDLGTLLGKRAT